MDFHVLLSESTENGHALRSRYVHICLVFTFIDEKQVEIGDRVVVNLRNQLGNETTSLHFHGLFQQGSNTMDGPAGVTQCPIPPGEKFTYDFVVSLRRQTEDLLYSQTQRFDSQAHTGTTLTTRVSILMDSVALSLSMIPQPRSNMMKKLSSLYRTGITTKHRGSSTTFSRFKT